MDKYEKSIYDYMNDIYYKYYNLYLDGIINFYYWEEVKTKLKQALEIVRDLEINMPGTNK